MIFLLSVMPVCDSIDPDCPIRSVGSLPHTCLRCDTRCYFTLRRRHDVQVDAPASR